MTINFSCDHCGKTLSTSDDKAGRKAKCPGCGEFIVVPATDEEVGTGAEASADESLHDDDGDLPLAPTAKRSSSAKMTCPMCGEKVSTSAKQCEFCGEPLQQQRSTGEPQKIDIGDVLNTGWAVFKAEMGLSIGIVIVAYLVMQAASIPQQMLNVMGSVMEGQRNQEAALLFQLGSVLCLPITMAGQIFISIGQSHALLKLVRGENASVGDIFGGGRFFWRNLGAAILFGLMVGAGTLLCIVPGIIVALMFWPFTFVLIDEDLPGIDCLWRAQKLTEGNRLSYFVVALACMGITILGFMAACVGVIFAYPLTWVICTVAYCRMTGQRTIA